MPPISLPRSLSRIPAHSRGFTLIELLVAMAVLALLLVLLAGITGQTQKAIRQETAKLDSQRAAGDFFEQVDRDLHGRVTVPGAIFFLGKQAGNDDIGFYTERSGFTGNRQASWVHYRINGIDTERGDYGIDYATGSGIRVFPSSTPQPNATDFGAYVTTFGGITPDYQALTQQILRMEISCLVEDSAGQITVKKDPPRNVDKTINTWKLPLVSTDPEILRGIVVTVVAMDSRDLVLVPEEKRAAIAGKFPDAEDGVLPGKAWSATADDAQSLAGAVDNNLSVASHIRVYDRTYRIQ